MCSYYTGDVADPDFVSKTVNSVIGKYGKIDILMNNAGHSSKNRNTQNTKVAILPPVLSAAVKATQLHQTLSSYEDFIQWKNNNWVINIK